jgi:hypothetical protein
VEEGRVTDVAEMKISKLDAAKRQMETAVRLYFSEADPVSIHTLTWAVYQVLADINKSRGGNPMVTEWILRGVLPDKIAEAKCRLSSAANFFKHANRDPDTILAFDPAQTEVLLFDVCSKYRDLTGEVVPMLGVYWAWFWLGPGADLVDVTKTKVIEQVRAAFAGASKASFFAEVLPLLSTIKL